MSTRMKRSCVAVMFAGMILGLPTVSRADDDGNAVALVNGHPIARQELIDTLIEAHGAEILQELIVVRAAKQEAHARGLKVTRQDVDREFQTSLDRIATEAGMDPDEATEVNKRAALQQLLDQQGLSLAEFMIGMERNAYLRPIAERDLRITEETLRAEFGRTYGEKVKISHIQIPMNDRRALDEALNSLARGADFADVARKLSRNPETAARAGEMDPFTFDDPDIPAIIRERAFSLKDGGVSDPLLAGQFFHIIKVHYHIPSQTARFEDKRDEIEKRIRERAVPQLMAKLGQDLYYGAKITVLDGDLRVRYQDYLDRAAARAGRTQR